jgi:hypothetical protein
MLPERTPKALPSPTKRLALPPPPPKNRRRITQQQPSLPTIALPFTSRQKPTLAVEDEYFDRDPNPGGELASPRKSKVPKIDYAPSNYDEYVDVEDLGSDEETDKMTGSGMRRAIGKQLCRRFLKTTIKGGRVLKKATKQTWSRL